MPRLIGLSLPQLASALVVLSVAQACYYWYWLENPSAYNYRVCQCGCGTSLTESDDNYYDCCLPYSSGATTPAVCTSIIASNTDASTCQSTSVATTDFPSTYYTYSTSYVYSTAVDYSYTYASSAYSTSTVWATATTTTPCGATVVATSSAAAAATSSVAPSEQPSTNSANAVSTMMSSSSVSIDTNTCACPTTSSAAAAATSSNSDWEGDTPPSGWDATTSAGSEAKRSLARRDDNTCACTASASSSAASVSTDIPCTTASAPVTSITSAAQCNCPAESASGSSAPTEGALPSSGWDNRKRQDAGCTCGSSSVWSSASSAVPVTSSAAAVATSVASATGTGSASSGGIASGGWEGETPGTDTSGFDRRALPTAPVAGRHWGRRERKQLSPGAGEPDSSGLNSSDDKRALPPPDFSADIQHRDLPVRARATPTPPPGGFVPVGNALGARDTPSVITVTSTTTVTTDDCAASATATAWADEEECDE
ncbi:hypothetical protein JCM24511_08867 [Saitozyma sp. JCM 24511]|nr:hypothetical protein JCM24511_08867 [Saitozyma sp. JCM 24511]